jgi:spore germination protein
MEQKNNAVEKVENIANGRPFIEEQSEKEKDLAQKIQTENAMRLHRLEVARLKAQKKAQKQQAKRLKKQREKEERQNQNAYSDDGGNTQSNKPQNKKGWLAAVISLSIATIVLACSLIVTLLLPTKSDRAIESVYSKSFYDTVEQVDNIDLNLSKTLATSDSGAMQLYLTDLAINSELAENDIQQLPLEDQSKYYTTKLINQIGDFAKYLNKKLIDGQPLSEKDYQDLRTLYEHNLQLKQSLKETLDKMTIDFNFSSIAEGGKGNLVIENFNKLQNLSVEYPELIYDGPFSDGLDRKEIKGLVGEEISGEQATEIFRSAFASFNPKEITLAGETSSSIQCFNVQAKINDQIAYAQISKKGGKIIMFSYSGSCDGVEISQENAVSIGEKFLKELGITDMKPVWVNLANDLYTINYAYFTQGVTVYSDLIKVRVCAQTGMVIGIEASSYYTNHVQRVINNPSITKTYAQNNLNHNITVKSVRLSLVPVGNSTEKLCYEFYGEYDGSDYYVYIDATNGKQVEMFKVIESTEGTLLM